MSNFSYHGSVWAQEDMGKEASSRQDDALDWNDEHIAWLGLKEGLARSKETGKAIMVLRYATWCSACQEFTSLFENERLVNASKELIMVRVDMDGEEAELAKQKLGEHASIPHVVFLGSSHERLPLTAEDTSASEHPYFYGDDVKKLVQNMRIALRDEEVFKPLSNEMTPPELLGKEIFDSSMLLPCPTTWDVVSHFKKTSFVCVIGDADNPRDVYTIELDSKKTVQRFTGAWRYNPDSELASMRFKKKSTLEEVKKWECAKFDVTLPESLPKVAREKLGETISHWRCEGFEITLLYDELGVIVTIVAPDRQGLNSLITKAREKFAP